MKPTVLLTNAIHPDGLSYLEQHADVIIPSNENPALLPELVRNIDGLIVRTQLPEDIFDFANRLRAVVRHGVGLDMIPVRQATLKGIPVANVPGANTAAVVEYCLSAILGRYRPLEKIDSLFRQRGWDAGKQVGTACGELNGATLGVVGVGAIGKNLGQLAAALGMTVLGLTRRPDSLPASIQAADKPALFSRADVVVLCCPLNNETRGLVDAAALAMMKKDAMLINVARGPVVDKHALINALNNNELGGAVLDVYDQQPLPGDDPLLTCPRLILTPHIAGTTIPSLRRMSMAAVHELLSLLNHRTSQFLVNPEVFNT
ncbi:hydroxyacid dehydrogenase [Paralcaligenes sp. KSB-10]|uniref:NAD(P)-dependent oxidoreductase n=1 Tax=Paralcaligenes sp. KSB-10 TaxID=2901142 RepID=UPI001E520C66|nr:NAD(P)-dependent oxidoreductase [Paralcaligenes sp. KSB-10]UHL65226.1 hydroxyacid dehydrogenase [Paralcaligenes sp. KSB-10]